MENQTQLRPLARPQPQPLGAPPKQDASLAGMDPVQRQIFLDLLPFREQVSVSFLAILSSNIAFLIKDKFGYKVEARQVSFTFHNISDNPQANMGQIVTITVHKGEGDSQLVLWSKSEFNQSVIMCLDQKVEYLLKEILRDVYGKDNKAKYSQSGGG